MEPNQDFPVSSEDCRLLLLLETEGSVRQVSQILRRDVSVITRQLNRLAEKTPFVEKLNGKWQISLSGKRLNGWTRDAILCQKNILAARTHLRVATTREFAARILAPRLGEFLNRKTESISIISSEDGVEQLLLNGSVDIGLDCGRPVDPSIRFQRVVPEPFSIVAAPKLLGGAKNISMSGLLELPHLQYTRLSTARALKLLTEVPYIPMRFNDLAAVRAAACAGLGWAVVPTYSVQEELNSGLLREVPLNQKVTIGTEQFGIWWHRDRRGLDSWIERITNWLQRVRL
ncbi:substrate-binding domain-containing protein [bacterium]|jgi:DNA-binding transcriptional LysR family regulator|nr:substrate-binding domain-containing protein [bacterium]